MLYDLGDDCASSPNPSNPRVDPANPWACGPLLVWDDHQQACVAPSSVQNIAVVEDIAAPTNLKSATPYILGILAAFLFG